MREAGILLPVFSLPSSGGVGTMGKGAVRFVDFLASAGQKWWQVLPVGPTGYGNSPYQSFSAFAGNPYLIDLPALAEEGECAVSERFSSTEHCDTINRVYRLTRQRLVRRSAPGINMAG